jgi:hypothetical protein
MTQLEWDELGVYDALNLVSKGVSEVPSLFIEDGLPMSLERLQRYLHRGSSHDAEIIARAIEHACDLGLMRYATEVGYELTKWSKTQTGIQGQSAFISAEKAKIRARVRKAHKPTKHLRALPPRERRP